jgi:hypothetical protein
MTYRVAAGVLAHLLPVAAGTSHETLRCRTLELGEQLRRAATATPEPVSPAAGGTARPASAITLSLDSTFIRGCHEGERHLEVRVGNAEAPESGARQVFGVVANAGTNVVALIRRTLDTLGCTDDTELTAFTDGCSGLRSILAAAGVTGPPIADWFHVSMRLQHAKQVAEALPAGDPSQQQAKAEIVTEVERLRWRTWHGKAKDARLTLKRLRALLPALEREPARKLRRALRAVDRYLRGQSAWLVNYAERHRAGLRVGTSLPRARPTSWSTGASPSRSRCVGPGAGPTCCCRSAAPSTTARSGPASASCSGQHPAQGRTGRRRRSPPNFQTVPSRPRPSRSPCRRWFRSPARATSSSSPA